MMDKGHISYLLENLIELFEDNLTSVVLFGSFARKNYGKNSDLDVIKNFENLSPLFSSLLLGRKILFDKNMFFGNLFKEFVKKMVNFNIKYCEGGKIWELRKIAKDLEISQ